MNCADHAEVEVNLLNIELPSENEAIPIFKLRQIQDHFTEKILVTQ